ncbi:MAG: flagellar brake protein [Deltaproteobacteria bacterium]|jgi:c-di-GMP-binding flagellar brake protein YcgR|nr:flagellar brake protein [Deltaproteobacteria bacterium]
MSDPLSTLPSEVLICGLRIRLLAMETTKSKWTTVFIGARPGRFLIFEMPRANNTPVRLDEASRWSVNFISNGQVYTFSSEVVGSAFRPYPLVFFAWPEAVDVSNLRTDKRYPVNIPITIETGSGPPQLLGKGLILDLSWGGCLAASTSEIPEGIPLRMNIYLDSVNTIEGLMIERKSCRNKQGTFYCGFSFLPTNHPTILDRIGEIITEIESSPLRI